jgi:biopolymer transport protein ExbB
MSALLEQGGWVLVAIFAASMLGWALIAWKWLAVHAETAGGLAWVEQVIDHARHARRDEARRLCTGRDNLAAQMLATALSVDAMKRRFFEKHLKPFYDAQATELRQHLNLIAVVGGICPLLGLLGTVLGMIVTFQSLTIGQSQASAELLAAGISQAMITTQAGLVLALPIVLMHGYLHSRITRYLDAITLAVKKLETTLCHD